MKEVSDNKNANLILHNSLKLFNRKGVQNTTTRDIASASAISLGNLTYHYKKKTDIVAALTDQLEIELTGVIEQIPNISATAEEHSDFLLRQLAVVWKYRFFFNFIHHLISVDPKQRKRFNQFRSTLVDVSTNAYEQLAINGSVKEIEPPNDLKSVMENIWYLWFSLIRLYSVVCTGRQSRKDFFPFSAPHLFSFLEPYYTDAVKMDFHEYLHSLIEK